jgi:hypothetical protein
VGLRLRLALLLGVRRLLAVGRKVDAKLLADVFGELEQAHGEILSL